MSVGRRGFLGVLAAAPIAGPAAMKEAAAQMATSQGTVNFAHGLSDKTIGVGGQIGRMMVEPDDAIRKAFRLGIVSREQLGELLSGGSLPGGGGLPLYHLDPDLQAAKSFSTATRFRLQRDRNREREIERFLAKPKSIWDVGRELIENGLISEDRP